MQVSSKSEAESPDKDIIKVAQKTCTRKPTSDPMKSLLIIPEYLRVARSARDIDPALPPRLTCEAHSEQNIEKIRLASDAIVAIWVDAKKRCTAMRKKKPSTTKLGS